MCSSRGHEIGVNAPGDWRLRLYGYRVTSDNIGCGTDSIRTYYAWLYEDSDRDDSDGPGTEVDTE